jgi:hypothetical protein
MTTQSQVVRALVFSAVAALSQAPRCALAEGNDLGYGRGGGFSDYDGTVYRFNQSGERFRIRGRCASACTLFLAIKNVCVERSARLMFHAGNSGHGGPISPLATAHMMSAYNSKLRSYLEAGGYMNTKQYHTISGREMIVRFGYRGC